MEDFHSRTEILIGKDAVEKLGNSTVAIFGVGGVGGFTVESLARAGVGKLILVDSDEVVTSNINRQIIATNETVGKNKVDAMKERILQINPDAKVETRCEFFLPENSENFDFADYDYVVDAVDTVTAKIELAVKCSSMGTPIISCMGAGNKLDPTKFVVTDIYKTATCPLARVMRRELRKRNIEKLKVVYSTEEPPKKAIETTTIGSLSFVPSVCGLIAASVVIKDLIK